MRVRRLVAVVISAVLLGTGLAAFQVSTAPPPAAVAADGRDFKPGNIISDAVFYNSSAMTAAQVQSFLNARVPSCRAGYTCLKDFRQTTGSQPARSEGCAAYAGRSNETAATIISRVASACGINPQALIVLLEKEQSLITDTWPTDRQYRSATGYGCPDTADCDANYYGFFNQVYHAAWQFKKYQARPLDRGYIAGRNNTILWHPNTGCGSSSVFIENQATAGLYVYTPYRPNAAALNNLYGTGDGCSSYGNRNFWRIFTDWFGPTTGGPAPLIVRADGQSAVYLVNGSTKHHISADDYDELLKAFGPRQLVSKAFVDGLSTGKPASRFLRNTATGVIAFVADGQTHRFPTCDLVALWGSSCGDGYLDLGAPVFSRAPVGKEMTKFALAPNGKTHLLEGSLASPMVNSAAIAAFNGGRAAYAARMPKAQFDRFTVGKTLAGPATFVKTAGSGAVYMIDGRDRRYHLPHWNVALEYGLERTATEIPKSVMDSYRNAGTLTMLAKCWAPLWAASGGKITELTSSDHRSGTAVTYLEAETCRRFDRAGSTVNGPLFYKVAGRPEVYILRYGKLHHISSRDQLFLQNNGSNPTILSIAPSTLSLFSVGAPALDIGGFVRRTGQSEVYLVNGWQLVHLPNWALADAYGKPRTVKVVGASTWSYAAYSMASKPLSKFARCYSKNYVAYNGQLYPVTTAQIGSATVTDLDPSVCRRIVRVSSPPPVGALRQATIDVSPQFRTPAPTPTPTPIPEPTTPTEPPVEEEPGPTPPVDTDAPSPQPTETAEPTPGPTSGAEDPAGEYPNG